LLESLQANNQDIKGKPKGFSPWKRAGGGIGKVEKEVYKGTNCIGFLPRKKHGGRDGRKRLGPRMGTIPIPRNTASPSGLSFPKANTTERNYEIYDKELLAIMEAFKEWKRYHWGQEESVTVYTDHENLQFFLNKKVWNQRQIRKAQELTNYNFKIFYRPGSRGDKPDALSRRPEFCH